MKDKILKFLLVMSLIATLSMTNFIIVGQSISVAFWEELESQDSTTNISNVNFDAYFLNNETKTHSKENLIDEEDTIILNVNVKNEGVLDDAKIKIENENFEIQKDEIKNDYVKNINLEANEIELNEIVYGNNIEIQVPIKFRKQSSFTDDYFEKENTISMHGTYKGKNEKQVSGQVRTRMIWKKETDVDLSQEIEKFLNLGENGVLLQQKIVTRCTRQYIAKKGRKIKN